MPFGLQWASLVLMRVMNSAMMRGPHLAALEPGPDGPTPGPPASGVPGAIGHLHRAVVVYMDDLLCYSPSLEQHLSDVREVLAILRQVKTYLKASKCAFAGEELGFLGVVDPRKVAAVRDWLILQYIVVLRSFVGLCNYYRRFDYG